jgi:Chitobiase/beta-hexosaminidase C-terminal domain/FG-GAP-like repeat
MRASHWTLALVSVVALSASPCPAASTLRYHTPITISTGAVTPGYFAVGDFNGDGKPDLAVPDQFGATVSVYLNQGGGTFSSPIVTTLSIPNTLGAILSGDFNEDGRDDLVVGTVSGNQASIVLLSNGDGTFTQQPAIPGSDAFLSGKVADLNGDRHLDLVLGGDGSPFVFFGDGKGTFTKQSIPNGSFPGLYSSVTVGDFLGNHQQDVVMADEGTPGGASTGPGSLDFYPASAGGVFASPTFYSLPPPAGLVLNPDSLDAADFNGDGKLDLLVGEEDLAYVAFGNGDGTFQLGASQVSVLGPFNYSNNPPANVLVAAADLNQDGVPDVAILSGVIGQLSLIVNDGTGTFPNAATTPYTFRVPAPAYAIAAADFNGDGLPDVVVASSTAHELTLVLSNAGPADAPYFSLAGGTFSSPQTLTLTAEPGATIYYTYTVNGMKPTTGSPVYTGPIAINSTGIVEAMATLPGYPNSSIASKAYVFSALPAAAAPYFNLAGGTYHSAQMLTLSDSTPGAAIHYTTNGTTPTMSSTLYTSPLTIASSETVQAIAIASGFSLSNVSTKAYTYVPYPPAASPSFSLAGGIYNTPQSLTLTDTTNGATIYYTTNGTAPTTNSAKYTGPITIESTELVQAVAIATAYNLSPVSAKAYTYSPLPLAAAPYFSLAGGHYATPQMLTLTESTPGATVYYTTNGTLPTTGSTRYNGPINISTSETVIAIAIATGYTNSNPASKAYTIP